MKDKEEYTFTFNKHQVKGIDLLCEIFGRTRDEWIREAFRDKIDSDAHLLWVISLDNKKIREKYFSKDNY